MKKTKQDRGYFTPVLQEMMIMIMTMIKSLYSVRTIKYSKALNIKLQLKQFPKANNNNNNSKKIPCYAKIEKV